MMTVMVVVLFCGISFSSGFNYFEEIRTCRHTDIGNEYLGKQNTSYSGVICANWNSIRLQSFGITEFDFPESNLSLTKNYCRNPNNRPNGPWCFVNSTDSSYEYCGIQFCSRERDWCKHTFIGIEYAGHINFTESGIPCQEWQSNVPHRHRYSLKDFKEKNFADLRNYCRNPDKDIVGPWCYTRNKSDRLEQCTIPLCVKDLSQYEYFGQTDIFSNNPTLHFVLLGILYANITVHISLSQEDADNGWLGSITVLSTAYNHHCQRDLNEYDPCRLIKKVSNESTISLKYDCASPLLSIVVLSPMIKSKYKVSLTTGPRYNNSSPANPTIEDYRERFRRSRENITNRNIPSTEYSGYFILLGENVHPYALSNDNETVMCISNVGEGKVGFIANPNYLTDNFSEYLKDFYEAIISDRRDVIAIVADDRLILQLDEIMIRGLYSRTLIIWDANTVIGQHVVDMLLVSVKNGSSLIVAFRPWDYNDRISKFENSELRSVLLHSGIWPSLKWIYGNLTIVKEVEVNVLPLELRLDYAYGGLDRSSEVADSVMNHMSQVHFERLRDTHLFALLHQKIDKLIRQFAPIINSMVPCSKVPLKISKIRERKFIFLINAICLYSTGNSFKAPGVAFYPGNVNLRTVPVVNVVLRLDLPFANEVVILGFYAIPGTEVSVVALFTRSTECFLYINHHLFDINNNAPWSKWPRTKRVFTVQHRTLLRFSFSFGGLLSLSCPENHELAEISLFGVVRIPMYDDRDNGSLRRWVEQRNRHVPWAVLATDGIVFVVPSIVTRNLMNPANVMTLWNNIVQEQYHLRGHAMSTNRRQIVSSDAQIKIGYMHSGYPIGSTFFSVSNPGEPSTFLFAEENMKTYGRWGMLHEIGHNLQDSLFTFKGTEEVTNNIFTLVATEALTRTSSWSPGLGWIGKEVISTFVRHIRNGTFEDWRGQPFLALGIYAQIRHSFGWEIYRQVFRRYNIMREYRDKSQINDHEKIQLWIKEISTTGNLNLSPLFELWKIPVDRATKTQLQHLQPFLPDDFLTRLVSNRVNNLINKYGGRHVVVRNPIPIPVVVGTLKDAKIIKGRINIQSVNEL